MVDKVLVVDDEIALQETLEYNLAKQGYQVFTAADGPAAIEIARREKPDLIVLDLMLPGLDGLEVCRVLRRDMNVPILMLTARADEIDRIVGLEIGADDYLTKPFSMRELLARVKALLRRVRLTREEALAEALTAQSDTLTTGDLVVDQSRRVAYRGGQALALKPRELDLLAYLLRHKGVALSREQLLQQVWGWDYVGSTRTVDVHVRWLREKVEDDPAAPTRIVTVRGIGYRLDG
ncbi:MAG: response regulator transcription factor [Chloroflexi bacterium]|nr:response regulator transcription factor [Chloroflexota bacterium]